ncbi:polysaccharide biosynthesis tyrosine autokinase [Flavihumibacter sp. R14]|nr:polysaccharide biosynthesis tyrosine autokinase [Flavihumibacter soli]
MDSQMVQFVSYNELPKEEENGSLRVTLKKYFFHWPLFGSAIATCLLLAFLYVRYADRIFNVRAQLLFKDEQTGSGHRESALQELDMVSSSKVVENEMEILKSRILMTKVVNDLQLWTAYKKVGLIADQDLYGQYPVGLVLLKQTGYFADTKFVIRILDDKKYLLKQGDQESEFFFSSKLKTGSGIWSLQPTEDLKNFIGETIIITVNEPDLVAQGILANFNTAVIGKQATVVELALKETVPERGKDILDRLIEVYSLAAIQDNNRANESTLKFLNERLAEVTVELTGVEKEVESFKSSKGLTDISAQSNFYLQNVTDNDRQLNGVNVEIEVLRGISQYINSPKTSRPPATTGISDPALATLVNQLINLESQRDRLLANTPESHPMFEPINRQLYTTRESIKDIIKGVNTSLLSTRRKLQSYDSKFMSSIRDLPSQERQHIILQRQQEIKADLYVYLLKKREEASLSYASTLSNTRIVQKAFYGAPISPRTSLTYAFALLMGFIIPAGFIYGRDILNNKVLDSKEIVNTTLVPLLGELMYQEGPKVIVMKEPNCRILAEQFRSLRTNLQFVPRNESNGRVTMLTSSMSGEGKSFIASNLGAAFSVSGRKTIILEMDLRKPTIYKYFGLEKAPGLTSYLNGTAEIEDIIQPAEGLPNLFIIRVGELPSNPSEVLEEPAIKVLIEKLRLSFDEILIDTPPVQLVTDGMIISQYCDIHLYVIRQGITYKSHLEYLKQLYQDKKLNNLHVVFNGVEISGRNSYKTDVDYAYYANDNIQKKMSLASTIRSLGKRF